VTRLGFVTGLKAESKLIAKAARRAGIAAPATACAGANADRARDAAERLIGNGAQTLVSFGLCGGLDPAVRPGHLILADEVLDRAGTRYATDTDLRARCFVGLRDAGLNPVVGPILGVNQPAASTRQKASLYTVANAVAVDMESHGVAKAAAAAGVPFLVLRAVADPAGRDIPRAALVAMTPDGGVRIGTVIAALLRRPWELAGMLRLASDARAGMRTLERAAPVLLGGG
jgi:adenosylhomocysteine nucleosidase